MTSKTLDRSRPFGNVYGGATGALYHQDGLLFNGAGEHVPRPGEAGAKAAPPSAEPVAAEAEGADREELEALHISQIKKLVQEEGLELETGPGSKGRNIDNLLAAAKG